MNKIWKIGIIAALLLAVLSLMGGCFPTTSTVSGNATASGTTEQSTWDSMWPMILFLVVIFAMFYFVMIRPQRKRQKEQQTMLESLQKGDKVITAGGIFGVIESVREDSVIIKVESGATMRVNKGSVGVRRDENKQ